MAYPITVTMRSICCPSRVNILAYYKSKNPNVIIVIENPMAYLRNHPVSSLFADVLGLTRVTISYCQFSTRDEMFPQKDTDLWTNSSVLVSKFGDGQFRCTPKKQCVVVDANGRHRVQAQDLPDKCSAYPSSMCRFIAGMLCEWL